MKFNKFLALTAAAGLAFSVNAYAAKEIKIASNNTPYSEADVQKLAATATGMGVKEPVSLNAAGGTVTVSGGELEYVDAGTLAQAVYERRSIKE